MFRQLGNILSRWWFAVIVLWVAAFVTLQLNSPPFDDLAKGGEFVFLPKYMASRLAESRFEKAFPGRLTTSSLVVVVHREQKDGLTDDDRAFITDQLTPALEQTRDRLNASAAARAKGSSNSDDAKIVTEIHNFSDRGIGDLLVSDDHKASLVTMELALDFQDTRNWEAVQDVESTLNGFERGNDKPKGLQLALTGSAVLGRDLTRAEADSARNTGKLTVALVIVLLVIIYRAPLLALIPLMTLFMAVNVSLHLLTLLARQGYVPIFKGLQVYTTVITYGPGIDYCLFLIARYKENLRNCLKPKEALQASISQVGPAIASSAATVICGIGMLTFAQFGKFHEAGMSISMVLVVTLLATLTLTPSLLFVVGHWAFWPMHGTLCDENAKNDATGKNVAIQSNLFQPMWTFMGGVIERHPLPLLLGTVAGMLPFAVIGVLFYGTVSYGLLESLPKSVPSAKGAQVLERHFPAGITGPVQVLLQNSRIDFGAEEGISVVHDLVDRLMKRHVELKIADIRSVADPLGTSIKADSEPAGLSRAVEKKAELRRSVEHYVSSPSALAGHATEMDIVLTTNPFAMESIVALDRLTAAVYRELPQEQTANTAISFVGPTAGVRDVNIISHSDQQRIYVLVVACVLAILVVLLRTICVSIYLIVTVLFSYIATLGATWLLFYGLNPSGFIGLDWTVPLFLFVVLIAIGEDYNIFLMTRIREEQKENGPKQGIVIALGRTGGIITSCGFIMAGTFASLCANSLVRMQQLGFALAFGVLLDTFIIRPILVPAFLMILNDERYGKWIRYLK